MSEVNALGL